MDKREKWIRAASARIRRINPTLDILTSRKLAVELLTAFEMKARGGK